MNPPNCNNVACHELSSSKEKMLLKPNNQTGGQGPRKIVPMERDHVPVRTAPGNAIQDKLAMPIATPLKH
jgi:hypothetical protein